MPELTPELARELGLVKELTDPTLHQGDMVAVRCDDGIERVGHFAIIDTEPYWAVFPPDLVIPLGRRGKVTRRGHV